MDESPFFWKMIPDITLSIGQTVGRKHDKAQITIYFACNITGTHKLEPLLIGKAVVSRFFSQLSVNIHNFQIV